MDNFLWRKIYYSAIGFGLMAIAAHGFGYPILEFTSGAMLAAWAIAWN